jgi:hypothetical protein
MLSGKRAGQTAFIPRIVLEHSTKDLPTKLCRWQFPIHIAFAMTINKLQGQPVKHVGLDLCTSVFSHGQLYVAFFPLHFWRSYHYFQMVK